jgi:hypothetical protein
MRISNRTAKRVRFHGAWMALFMLADAVASTWFAFDQILPISPMIYAGLGLFFAIASGIGHLYRN